MVSKAKIVFLSQGPKFECTPIPLHLLKHYALTDAGLAGRCEFSVKRLLQFENMAPQEVEARCCSIAEEIVVETPTIIALSLYCWNTANLLKIAALCKQFDRNSTIIAGGPDTFGVSKSLLLGNPALDVVLPAPEGELAFKAFLQCSLLGRGNMEDVPFVHFRDGERIIRGRNEDYLSALDEIPSAVLPYGKPELVAKFYQEEDESVILETSRGCPVNCAFCQYPKMGRSMRYYSLERVFKELEHLRGLGVRSIYFSDGIFTLQKDRARDIFQYFLKTHTDCVIHCEVKLDILNPELLDDCGRLIEQGRLDFGIGVQSTNKVTLKTMGRPCDFEKLERKIKSLGERGRMRWDLIYGLPGDEFVDLLAGLDYVNSVQPGAEIAVQPLLALPGTEYRSSAEKFGLVYDPAPPYVVIRSNTFSVADMKKASVVSPLVSRFNVVFRIVYHALGGRGSTLFRDVFAGDYFDHLRGDKWFDRQAQCHHFVQRLRPYLYSRLNEDERGTWGAALSEALDWEYLNLDLGAGPISPELLQLPSLFSAPGGKAPANGRIKRNASFILRNTLDDAHVFRFHHLHDRHGQKRIVLQRASSPRYLIVNQGRKLLLSQQGFELLCGFREPLTLGQSLQRLSKQFGSGDEISWEDIADVRNTMGHYVRAGLLRPSTPITACG